MLTGDAGALIAAVDEGFDAQVALTADLVRFPSVRARSASLKSSWLRRW
jgi:hypothetical protein